MIKETYELSPIGKKLVDEITQFENCESFETFLNQFKQNSDKVYHAYQVLEREFKKEEDPENSETVNLTRGDKKLYGLLEKSTHIFMSMHEPLSSNIAEYREFYNSLKKVTSPENFTMPNGGNA